MHAAHVQALLLLLWPALALAEQVRAVTPPWSPRWMLGTTVAVLFCTLLGRMRHWLPLLVAFGAATLWAVVRLSDGSLAASWELLPEDLARPEVLPIHRVLVVAQALLPPAAVIAALALRRRNGAGRTDLR